MKQLFFIVVILLVGCMNTDQFGRRVEPTESDTTTVFQLSKRISKIKDTANFGARFIVPKAVMDSSQSYARTHNCRTFVTFDSGYFVIYTVVPAKPWAMITYLLLFWIPVGKIYLLIHYCIVNKITFVELVCNPINWKKLYETGFFGLFTPIAKDLIDKRCPKEKDISQIEEIDLVIWQSKQKHLSKKRFLI